MSGIVILIIVLVVIAGAVAAALVTGVGTRGRGGGRDLRRRFGPEYDRLAEERGDPKAVEQELAERVREHGALTLRPLAQGERERYDRTWAGVQERFVDDPRGAVQQADQVIGGLMTAIGYPSQDRDRQLALASVDHAYALSDYRQARELVQHAATTSGGVGSSSSSSSRNNNADGTSTDPTESLRQAILHYRVMFKDLLDRSASGSEPARAGR
jgi:hypothetical protein